MPDIKVHEHFCAVCGYRMDSVLTIRVNGEYILPKPGDLSVCASCLAIGVFKKDLSLRVATNEECDKLPDWMKLHIAMLTMTRQPQEKLS